MNHQPYWTKLDDRLTNYCMDFIYRHENKGLNQNFLAPSPELLAALSDRLSAIFERERACLLSTVDVRWIDNAEQMCLPGLLEHNLRFLMTENCRLVAFVAEKMIKDQATVL